MFEFLPRSFTAVVVGAGGGIAQAMIQRLLEASDVVRLIAVSRRELHREDPRFEALQLDVSREEGRLALAAYLDRAPVHLVINTIGVLHDDALGIVPEKRIEELSAYGLAALFNVNAVTPVLVIQALRESLIGHHPAVVASLSARVGSITDNGLGGWYGYRASKAAHNMLLRTVAIELARYNRQSIVLCLHPGTTDTPLSRPFQANVPAGKLFSPDFVAERLLDVMAERRPEDSGSFWDWSGKPVPW